MTACPPEARPLRAGDAVLFIDRKNREYLHVLAPGGRLPVRDGWVVADDLLGQPEGLTIHNSVGEPFIVLRPTFAQLVPNLPRQAQVIYPKDIGPILLWADIHPGASVIEVGVGPGALSIALLRAIGPAGRLITYEIRDDFAALARKTVERFHGAAPHWTLKVRDATLGFDERNVDRMTVDMPEPWRVVAGAGEALRPGGLILGYVPTVLQVKTFVDALRAHSGFAVTHTFETLQRFWHVEGPSVRPEHRMVAHTGFIIVARRLAPR